MNTSIIDVCMWISQFLYFLCFVPQIVTNARLRSASGLSHGLLIAFFNGYGAFFLYSYALGLPFAYQLLAPLQGVALLVLIFQRFWYARHERIALGIIGYILNALFYLAWIPFVIKQPAIVGGIFGWVSFVLFLINQFPQAIKVHREKSVVGFSYTFVLIQGTASLLETVVSLVAGLPVQTFMMALRGVIMFGFFSLQFVWYKGRHHQARID